MTPTLRVFFVSDIHGSTRCFRKFLNSIKTTKNPDVLIIGGDLTGKYFVPIVEQPTGRFTVMRGRHQEILESNSAVTDLEEAVADKGAYPFRISGDDLKRYNYSPVYRSQIQDQLIVRRIEDWLELAEERLKGTGRRLYINAGNDDPEFIDPIIDKSSIVVRPEGKVIDIGHGISMLSCGYSNKTPFNCPRDITEEELRDKIAQMTNATSINFHNALFNFHCPPKGTRLDNALAIDKRRVPIIGVTGPESISAGSLSVRQAIESFQPQLSLHGHIHESPGQDRIGRTICYNPGTEYSEGRLSGVYLEFRGPRLSQHCLTREEVQMDPPSRDLRVIIRTILRYVGLAELFAEHDDRKDRQIARLQHELEMLRETLASQSAGQVESSPEDDDLAL